MCVWLKWLIAMQILSINLLILRWQKMLTVSLEKVKDVPDFACIIPSVCLQLGLKVPQMASA